MKNWSDIGICESITLHDEQEQKASLKPAVIKRECRDLRALRSVDQSKIERAVAMILEAIGEDPSREGLQDTPSRVARMYSEICSSMDIDPSTALTCMMDEPYEDVVLVKGIRFASLCEHHLLPFCGYASIAYKPRNGAVTGLSKLARVVELAARRPQVQERMTERIADALVKGLDPEGVAVTLNAEHMCMTIRGVQKAGSSTTTAAYRGIFKTDRDARAEVLAMIRS